MMQNDTLISFEDFINYGYKALKYNSIDALILKGQSLAWTDGSIAESIKVLERAYELGSSYTLSALGGVYLEICSFSNSQLPPNAYDLLPEKLAKSGIILPKDSPRKAKLENDPQKVIQYFTEALDEGHPGVLKPLLRILPQFQTEKSDEVLYNLYARLFMTEEDYFAFVELAKMFLTIGNRYHDDKRGFHFAKVAYEHDEKSAAALLGRCYQNGQGVKKDFQLAIKYYEEAARNGELSSLNALANMYRTGDGVPKDEKKADEYLNSFKTGKFGEIIIPKEKLPFIQEKDKIYVKMFEDMAKKGNAKAYSELGQLYQDGDAIKKSHAKAMYYWRKGAEMKNVECIKNLAKVYDQGIDEPKNPKKAFELYQKLADMNNVYGLFMMGVCHEDVEYGQKDFSKAAYYFQKAADMGDIESMAKLGYLYCKGFGVKKDLEKGIEYYKKGVAAGHGNSMYRLGYIYMEGDGVPKDLKIAVELFKMGVGRDDPDSMYILGYLMLKADGIAPDDNKAFELIKKSSDYGNLKANPVLGLLYKQGIGTKQDYKKMLECWKKCDYSISPQALFYLSLAYQEGIGVKKNLNTAKMYMQQSLDANCAEATRYSNGLDDIEWIDVRKRIS